MPELVPRVVLDMVARGESRREWEALTLFADVSGFTAMTERLAAHGAEGAELLADALRAYFDPMLSLVQEAGGVVTGFAGDAFTALFPDDGGAASCEAALAASAGMRDFFGRHPVRATRFGDFAFALKLGLCADRVRCDVVRGSYGRSIGYFHGPGVDRSAAAEHHAGRGDVVLSPEVAARVRGWQVEEREGHARLGARAGQAPRREFPSAPHSAGLRGEALFLPRSALGFPVEGEFRDVTAVFFSFGPSSDAPALARLLMDELRRFGDGALRIDFGDKGGVAWTFFGAPVSFEDQVDRALAFARAVVARHGGEIRAGVARGVVYAGFLGGRARAEFTCLGRPVNLAARLMARAPWGEVWCSQSVCDRARRHDFSPRGEHPLKGFAAPIAAFAASGQALPAPRKAAAMLGREAELQALEALVAPALHGQLAGVIHIDGEAGVGKTTLMAALAERLQARPDEAPVTLWGACHAFGEPCGPLRAALWGGRDVVGDAPEDEAREALALLCAWGPVVLLLDDAEHIDEASLRVLRAVARPPAALAIVLAVRPDDRGNLRRFDLGQAPAHAIELRPLDEPALQTFLAHDLGIAPDAGLTRRVMEASGGNPLLVRQIIASIRPPAGEPGAPPAPGALPPGHVPEDAAPLLVARLDRLSVNVRRTVQVASVLGPSLDVRALMELLGSQPRVQDYVRLASMARIWSHLDDHHVVFRSGLLRDTAFQMLPRSRLRRLLRTAADLYLRQALYREALYVLDQLLPMLPAQGAERRRAEQDRASAQAALAAGSSA